MTNIKSVEKAIDILSCFTVETPSDVTEISFLTGFNQSTVSRILATLEKKKCMERETPGGKIPAGHQISSMEKHYLPGDKPR